MRLIQNSLIALVACASLAQSAHISIDSEFGPKTITRDTTTGLEWLNLRVTMLRSTDWVNEEMAPGESLHGWRYASTGEVMTFARPYLVPIPPNTRRCCLAPLQIEGMLTLINLLGPGYGPGYGMWGLTQPYGDLIGTVSLNVYITDADVDIQSINYPVDCMPSGCGMFLVRTIPEASSAGYILAGLFFCTFLRRKTRQ